MEIVRFFIKILHRSRLALKMVLKAAKASLKPKNSQRCKILILMKYSLGNSQATNIAGFKMKQKGPSKNQNSSSENEPTPVKQ